MDTIRFLAQFSHPISESTSHLYVSALPFAPVQSELSRHYLKRWPRVLTVDIGKHENWPRLLMTMEKWKMRGTSVAFSPDGNLIAFCSYKAIHVLDAQTGTIVSGPFEDDSEIMSIAFSPDGQHIVSGSGGGTICVWDVQTGIITLGPLAVQEKVTCVAFSPHGKYVAFSTEKGISMIVCDTGTGELIWTSNEGQYCLAFSRDGKQIVSAHKHGSYRHSICIWDVQTGQSALEPLCDRYDYDESSESVVSVSFTPDGQFVFSTCQGGRIRRWNLKTGVNDMVLRPFDNLNKTMALDVSSDGTLCAAISYHGDIVIVNTLSGSVVYCTI